MKNCRAAEMPWPSLSFFSRSKTPANVASRSHATFVALCKLSFTIRDVIPEEGMVGTAKLARIPEDYIIWRRWCALRGNGLEWSRSFILLIIFPRLSARKRWRHCAGTRWLRFHQKHGVTLTRSVPVSTKTKNPTYCHTHTNQARETNDLESTKHITRGFFLGWAGGWTCRLVLLSCHSALTRRRRPLAGYAVMIVKIVKISDVSLVWRNHMCFPSIHADGGFPSAGGRGTCVYVLCNSDRSVEGILTATARNPLVSSTKKGGWMVGGAGEAVLQMRCIWATYQIPECGRAGLGEEAVEMYWLDFQIFLIHCLSLSTNKYWNIMRD